MKIKSVFSLGVFLVSGLLALPAFADSTANALRAVQTVEAVRKAEMIQKATDPFRLCVSKLYFVGDIEFQEAACNCALDIIVEGCEPYREYIDFYLGTGPMPTETNRNDPVSA